MIAETPIFPMTLQKLYMFYFPPLSASKIKGFDVTSIVKFKEEIREEKSTEGYLVSFVAGLSNLDLPSNSKSKKFF